MNSVVRGLQVRPYRRAGPAGLQPKASSRWERYYDALVDGLDLCLSMTAPSWEHGVPNRALEAKQRASQTRGSFIVRCLVSAAKWALVLDFTHQTVCRILDNPHSVYVTPTGRFTIFDTTLSPFWSYTKGWLISVMVATLLVSAMEILSELSSAVCVGVSFAGHGLGTTPDNCPPGIHSPWFATSVSNFWGYRWHQWTRLAFLNFAGKPLAAVTGGGRFGLVMGTFIASAITHDVGAMRISKSFDGQGSLLFFTMMGVGVVLEYLWKTVTGFKVRGVGGWVWTMIWMLGFGSHYVDGGIGLAVVDLYKSDLIPQAARPSKILFDFFGR